MLPENAGTGALHLATPEACDVLLVSSYTHKGPEERETLPLGSGWHVVESSPLPGVLLWAATHRSPLSPAYELFVPYFF